MHAEFVAMQSGLGKSHDAEVKFIEALFVPPKQSGGAKSGAGAHVAAQFGSRRRSATPSTGPSRIPASP